MQIYNCNFKIFDKIHHIKQHIHFFQGFKGIKIQIYIIMGKIFQHILILFFFIQHQFYLYIKKLKFIQLMFLKFHNHPYYLFDFIITLE